MAHIAHRPRDVAGAYREGKRAAQERADGQTARQTGRQWEERETVYESVGRCAWVEASLKLQQDPNSPSLSALMAILRCSISTVRGTPMVQISTPDKSEIPLWVQSDIHYYCPRHPR